MYSNYNSFPPSTKSLGFGRGRMKMLIQITTIPESGKCHRGGEDMASYSRLFDKEMLTFEVYWEELVEYQ